ncbi:MAG: YheU family protein [Gammaproteobacteria bacterium]
MSGSDTAPVIVPHTALSDTALRGVIEAFVLREGTDYGSHEYSLADKVAHVHAQLVRGDATIVFDPDAGTVDIVRTSGLYSGQDPA